MAGQLGKTLVGELEIDGERRTIKASTFKVRVSDTEASGNNGEAARDGFMGTQVTETFSISGDTVATSVTVRSGGTTTTTSTVRDEGGTTTTTTTSDSSGSSTTIKITKP